MNRQVLTWDEVLRRSSEWPPLSVRKVVKTADEWRALLSPEQYRVTRERGTERAFGNEMCRSYEAGKYLCTCCQTLLFDSSQKFDSGTGWPSFTLPANDNAVAYVVDKDHGMVRVEAICNTCDAHLGHVFPDGPAPSRLRFCINSVALQKV